MVSIVGIRGSVRGWHPSYRMKIWGLMPNENKHFLLNNFIRKQIYALNNYVVLFEYGINSRAQQTGFVEWIVMLKSPISLGRPIDCTINR